MSDTEPLSRMRIYSLGTVAINKPPSTDHIEVIPDEHQLLMDGQATDNAREYKGEGVNVDGTPFTANIISTDTIKAKWLPLGADNRVTSPDVRRGEKVMIYQFADADEYFWVTLRQDVILRRLETVIYSYSNNSKENVPNDADTSYYLEVSTQKKLVTFHTAKNDGELCSYTVQINTKDGCLTITDDIGNYLLLDSKQIMIALRNALGSMVNMTKKNVSITAPGVLTLNTPLCEINSDQVNITGNLKVGGRLDAGNISAGDISCVSVNASGSVNAPNLR